MTQTQQLLSEDEKASKVLFVIITDGLENASLEYNSRQVKRLVEERRKKDNWEFLFLGANIDAIKTADDLGISREMAADYHADKKGTALSYGTVCSAVSMFRRKGAVSGSWSEDIKKDFTARKK